MAYAFKAQDSVADQVRSIAIEQIDKALDAMAAKADFDETVHTVRKSCKKLRALLKMVRPNFPDYVDENAAIRAIAARFSVARDAAVLVETMSSLMESDEARDEGALTLMERLRERAAHLRSQMGETELLELATSDFEQARQRVKGWSFDASGAGLVQPGVASAYRRFRKRLKLARKTPEGEVVHDWRKAAKAWWYHVRLCERTAPAILEHLSGQLDQLGTLLGDHHNLTILADWIASARAPDDNAADGLLTAIAARQSELADTAFALGRQLAAERPSNLADRFGAYWKLLE